MNSTALFLDLSFKSTIDNGLPEKEGQYLIKYFNRDEDFLPSYMLAWFKDGAFYQGKDCHENATLEGFFGHKVFEYVYLPNLRSKTGDY